MLTKDEAITARLRAARRVKYLVDENLGEATAQLLREMGHNVEFGPDVGLGGHNDGDVFQYAWRNRRTILTHDTDFLDDRKFPEHSNPGVIVLPGGSGDDLELLSALFRAISHFGKDAEFLVGVKIYFTHSDAFRIRLRNFDTGAMEETRFRLTRHGLPLIWEED